MAICVVQNVLKGEVAFPEEVTDRPQGSIGVISHNSDVPSLTLPYSLPSPSLTAESL